MQCHEMMWNDLAAGSALFNSEAVVVEISAPKGGLSARRDLLSRREAWRNIRASSTSQTFALSLDPCNSTQHPTRVLGINSLLSARRSVQAVTWAQC